VISLVAESLCAFKVRILAFPKYVFLYTTYTELPDLKDLFEKFGIKYFACFLVERVNEVYG